jgi:VWFA-related protein
MLEMGLAAVLGGGHRVLRRVRAIPCLAAALGLATAGPGAATQQTPEFSVGSELVRIDAVVLDDGAKPVTGLTADDFEIEENGDVQPIVSFEAIELSPSPAGAPEPEAGEPRPLSPEQTRYLLVYFDDTHLSPLSVAQLQQGLGPFFARQLGDQDRVTLIAPESDVYWTSRSRAEHRLLPEVLKRLHGSFVRYPTGLGATLSEWGAMRAVELFAAPQFGSGSAASRGATGIGGVARGGPAGAPEPSARPEETYEIAKRRLRATLGGLDDVIRRLAPMKGRKVLLLFSEGFIQPPYLREFDAVVDLARRANVVVDFVNPQALSPSESIGDTAGADFERSPLGKLETGAAGSAFVAEVTGGRSPLTNDVTEPVRTELLESSAYYLLGYALPDGKREERRVKVRVRRKGLEVRARSRYYVGASERDDAADRPPAERALRALDDVAAVPARVRTLARNPGSAGTTAVLEIPPADDHRGRRLRLLVEARPLAGGAPFHDVAEITISPTPQPTRVTRDWALAPGVWQARIVVEDMDTNDLGSLTHTFEVGGP